MVDESVGLKDYSKVGQAFMLSIIRIFNKGNKMPQVDYISSLWGRLWWLIMESFPNHQFVEHFSNILTHKGIFEWMMHGIESIGAWKTRDDFEDVERFCLFVGHARSGHSLIGALLDAHPNMIIAHEIGALGVVKNGISRARLFFQLLARSRWFKRMGVEWTSYSYDVPTQHKAQFTSLKVIGNKKGGGSANHLRKDPNLLKKLSHVVGVPVHVVHVKRHPLDNIATMARKGKGDIDDAIERYFQDCRSVKNIKERVLDGPWLNWLDVIQEEFIYDSKSSLRDICHFLKVDVTDEYLEDCSEIVFDSPSRSRKQVNFDQYQLDRIRENAKSFSILDK
jgi:hypothetical protein